MSYNNSEFNSYESKDAPPVYDPPVAGEDMSKATAPPSSPPPYHAAPPYSPDATYVDTGASHVNPDQQYVPTGDISVEGVGFTELNRNRFLYKVLITVTYVTYIIFTTSTVLITRNKL